MVEVQLGRALLILSFLWTRLLLPDQPWLDAQQLIHEIVEVNNEVLYHWKIGQRLDQELLALELVKEGCACEFRNTVDVGAATSADAHPARPAVGQGPVQLGLDM